MSIFSYVEDSRFVGKTVRVKEAVYDDDGNRVPVGRIGKVLQHITDNDSEYLVVEGIHWRHLDDINEVNAHLISCFELVDDSPKREDWRGLIVHHKSAPWWYVLADHGENLVIARWNDSDTAITVPRNECQIVKPGYPSMFGSYEANMVAVIEEQKRLGRDVTKAKQQLQNAGEVAANPTQSNTQSNEVHVSNNENAQAKYAVEVKRAPMEVQEVIIPTTMKVQEAIEWLRQKEQEENQQVQVYEVITSFPMDGAYALALALKEKYRIAGTQTIRSFFGDIPPRMVNVVINAHGDKLEVPWGRLAVPQWEGGYVETGMTADKNGRRVLLVTGKVKRRVKPEVDAIIERARELLKTESLIKGKAFTLDFARLDSGDPADCLPEFINLKGIDEKNLIFPDEVMRVVKNSLFTPVEFSERCRKHGVPLRRGVLLEGPYGVGKTLTANVLAKKATEHGWTYILVRNADQLAQALLFARSYCPAVVFCEDVDEVLGTNDRDSKVNAILNTLDGVDGKHSEILTVLTSNHADTLNAALLRPGRLDTVIPVRPPDPAAVRKLLTVYGRGLIAPDADLKEVGHVLAGQIPAVIRETVERAKLAAIARTDGETFSLSTDDLLDAARGMVMQVEACRKKETPPQDVGEQFLDAIAERTYHNIKNNGIGSKLEEISDLALEAKDFASSAEDEATAAKNEAEETKSMISEFSSKLQKLQRMLEERE